MSERRESLPADPPVKPTEGANGSITTEASSPVPVGNADDPYRPPVPLLDQPARTVPNSRRQMPGTVIAVIVLVSVLGAVNVITMIRKPTSGVAPVGITAVVLVGLIYGKTWARILALVLASIASIGSAYIGLSGDIAGNDSPDRLIITLPPLMVLLGINISIFVLLFTRSARRYFGAAV